MEEININDIEKEMAKIKIGQPGGADDVDPEIIKWLGGIEKEWLLEMIKKP